jgi:hypothetical protein
MQPAELTRLVSAYIGKGGLPKVSTIQSSTVQLFEALLLSVPRTNKSAVSSDVPKEIVGELLSSPQACLN